MIPHPFEQNAVQLQNGQWTEEVSLQVCDITQCPARQLWLYNNHRATIPKEIAHIHFTDLTRLHLGGNEIESVEGLARVQMTHIKRVHLKNNNITSIGVIRKAAWPRLSLLSMEGNYSRDVNELVHGWFPQLELFYMYNAHGDDKNRFTEQCFPAKIQPASLNYLYIRQKKFCFDRCLKRVLQERLRYVVMQ